MLGLIQRDLGLVLIGFSFGKGGDLERYGTFGAEMEVVLEVVVVEVVEVIAVGAKVEKWTFNLGAKVKGPYVISKVLPPKYTSIFIR